MNERMYISEILKLLRYKDRRSVIRWCRNQGIKILSDIGSNRKYILRYDFESVLARLHGMKTAMPSPDVYNKINEYQPGGQLEGEFFRSLQVLFTNP